MAECRVCGRRLQGMIRENDGKYRCTDPGCNDKKGTFIPYDSRETVNSYVPPSQRAKNKS